MRKKLGECLIQAGLITEDDLQTALAEHKRSGERLGAVLVRMNLATDRQIAKALAYQLGFAYVNLAENAPDQSAVILIPKDVALKRTCIAIGVEKNLLTVAMSDPLLFTLVQDLEFQTGYRIKQVVSTKQEIVDAIHQAYPDKALARLSQHGSGIAVQVTTPRPGQPGGRLPCLDAADDLRREARAPHPRQSQGRSAARRAGVRRDLARADPVLPAPSARHDSRRRSDRLRQDDDALLGVDLGAVGAN